MSPNHDAYVAHAQMMQSHRSQPKEKKVLSSPSVLVDGQPIPPLQNDEPVDDQSARVKHPPPKKGGTDSCGQP